jgi:hypothetical protein
VVLSTELAGMEFMLGRASVVIGRTDENDVQLNHRSISRHHAKVVATAIATPSSICRAPTACASTATTTSASS